MFINSVRLYKKNHFILRGNIMCKYETVCVNPNDRLLFFYVRHSIVPKAEIYFIDKFQCKTMRERKS